MKQYILIMLFTLAGLAGMAQTNEPLPGDAEPLTNQLYLSPSDSTVWAADPFSGLAIKVGTWFKVDSLFGLGYTKVQVDSAIAAKPIPTLQQVTDAGNTTTNNINTSASIQANAFNGVNASLTGTVQTNNLAVTGIASWPELPTDGAHLTNKEYVDEALGAKVDTTAYGFGLSWNPITQKMDWGRTEVIDIGGGNTVSLHTVDIEADGGFFMGNPGVVTSGETGILDYMSHSELNNDFDVGFDARMIHTDGDIYLGKKQMGYSNGQMFNILRVENDTHDYSSLIQQETNNLGSVLIQVGDFQDMLYTVSMHGNATMGSGLLYGGDYSADYTNRSLVDKAYVDVQVSDSTLKNISIFNPRTAANIKTITYTWKDGRDSLTHIGYTAQDVQKYLPDAVELKDNGVLGVRYLEVLAAKIAALEARLAELESK